MSKLTRDEILSISQKTFGIKKREKESNWTVISIEDLEMFTEAVEKEVKTRSAEIAYEFLDDPFLSGHGYATGCYNAILNK
jgi:hypothetical protein